MADNGSMSLTDLVIARGWQPTSNRLKHIATYVCNFYLQWKPCSTLSSTDNTLVAYESTSLPFINAMLDQYATWFHYDGKPAPQKANKGKQQSEQPAEKGKKTKKAKKSKPRNDEDDDEEGNDAYY